MTTDLTKTIGKHFPAKADIDTKRALFVDEFSTFKRRTNDDMVRLGLMLQEIKEESPPRTFEPWLREVGINPRTAREWRRRASAIPAMNAGMGDLVAGLLEPMTRPETVSRDDDSGDSPQPQPVAQTDYVGDSPEPEPVEQRMVDDDELPTAKPVDGKRLDDDAAVDATEPNPEVQEPTAKPKPPTPTERLKAENHALNLELQEKAERIEALEEEVEHHRNQQRPQAAAKLATLNSQREQIRTLKGRVQEWQTKYREAESENRFLRKKLRENGIEIKR